MNPAINYDENLRCEWGRFNLIASAPTFSMDLLANHICVTCPQVIDYLQLRETEKILDVGCRDGDLLLDLIHHRFPQSKGMDISPFLLQKARITAKHRGIVIDLKEGDPRRVPYAQDSFNAILLRGNILGTYDAAQGDLKVLKECFRVLLPTGKCLIEVCTEKMFQKKPPTQSWEWNGKKYTISWHISLSSDQQRVIIKEILLNAQNEVMADRLLVTKVYTIESITDLVSRAGFRDIRIHPSQPEILCLSAISSKEVVSTKPKTAKTGRVVGILFGTPSKSDVVKPSAVYDEDSLYTNDIMLTAMREIPGYQFLILQNHENLYADLNRLRGRMDYVLNLCDEGFNNEVRYESHLPSLMEILKIPYTGATPQCLAICADKSIMRGIALEMGIPIAQGIFINPSDTNFDIPFTFPVIVKPATGNSSFAITQRSVARNAEEFLDAISEAQARIGYEQALLVEEYLPGADLSVGIIGNPPSSYIVLPITQEDYSTLPAGLPSICGYEAKWLPDSPYNVVKSVPSQLPSMTLEFVSECSAKLFSRLECRDYARFDWRLDAKGVPRLLEINPNCGTTWDGHLYHMARHNGMSYGDMMETILHAAEDRLGLPPIR